MQTTRTTNFGDGAHPSGRRGGVQQHARQNIAPGVELDFRTSKHILKLDIDLARACFVGFHGFS